MMFSAFKYSHTLLAHKRLSFVFTSQSRSFEKLVKIGNVSAAISKPKNPLLVPINYLPKSPSKTTLEHLQWIMKKDILGQDVFLIGLPGPSRARVILQYLELMQREVEYVVLTRDTTENDLKQRREIVDGTAHFVDQSAVTAAVEGRFLILDGIEKAERNVLPILNNLLENREMQLEDGRFLLGHERYDKLLLKHTKEELDALKLVRISENFRVVALGLPVPPFKGNPLDPPFRSRFQARHVQSSYEDQVLAFSNSERKIDESSFKSFLSACYALISPEAANLGLLKFPVENLSSVIKILAEVPSVSRELLIRWMYPYNIILSKESQKSVKGILETFSILHEQPKTDFKVTEKRDSSHPYLTHSLEISSPRNVVECDIIGHKANGKHSLNFVPNSYHNRMLAEMLQTHISHDFCMTGEKGSGKTMLVRKFAALLNYPIEMIMLYKDMTARDFLQQRVTDESGNTLWKSSPIVEAALAGKLLVLDGLHRLHSSIFSILQRLIHNRELQLYDGTRLISHDQYDTLKKTYELSDSDMEANKILPVHPAFRIIGLAEPPKLQNSKDQWVTPEIMSMFLFHTIRPLSLKEEAMVINSLVGKMDDKFNSVLTFAHALRNSADDALQSVSASFSTRQLVRIARRLHNFPEENVYNLVTQACVMSFLPQLTKKAVENVLENCDIKSVKGSAPKEIFVADDMLHVGSTTAPLFKPGSSEVKVPEILFYNSPEHLQVMEAMLQDFLLGEHLLLIGNQGVGKNKITDRFLQLLNRPREYIQLHRDTTVQSLTQQPTVRDGKIMYEDSPLLKAVQNGHVLVVDEADKAPTHVTSVLKALVESGEMILSDGRRIIHHSDQRPSDDKHVVMHPDFRMIVLANRPGFPFLGNDFFATLGDIFSCHAVDNPSLESEMSMLRQYGPNVPEYVLDKLAKFFGELRSMSDAGLISYPYSTREVVNIVKHIDKFPNEGISFVLKNVFDFDSFSSELKETLNNLFEKYGIPNESQVQVKLSGSFPLPNPVETTWSLSSNRTVWSSVSQKIIYSKAQNILLKEKTLDMTDTRGTTFSEQQYFCDLHLSDVDIPTDILSVEEGNENIIYVSTANPIGLHRISPNKMSQAFINMSNFFPTVRSGFKPSVNIAKIVKEGEDFILLQERTSDNYFLIQPSNGVVIQLNMSSFFEEAISKLSNIHSRSVKKLVHMCKDFPSQKKVLFCQKLGTEIIILDFETNEIHRVRSPENIRHVSGLTEKLFFLLGEENSFIADFADPNEWKVRILNRNKTTLESHFSSMKLAESKNNLSLVSDSENYLTTVSGSLSDDSSLNVKMYPRESSLSDEYNSCILPQNSQIITFLQKENLPIKVQKKLDTTSDLLEIVDYKSVSSSYVPIHLSRTRSSYTKWLANSSKNYLLMCTSPNNDLFTIDSAGVIRKWETGKQSLQNSFLEWKKLAGVDREQLNLEYVNKNLASKPKHGKVDPTGAPHVGGNRWAGGTGGRDTAGFGGKGGPYRLDAGHDVYQVSDQEKEAVPLEVREAAREMAMKVYKERLKEIEMSDYDAEMYEKFFNSVKKEVNLLRVILDSLQAKSKERLWLRHQTSGELDDMKLIESITGEKLIYKRRGDQEPEIGSPQEKPKLLRLVVDVSGSMYRFNGHDGRLEREMESLVLVMEALDGYFDKLRFEIVGHSGEDYNIDFSQFDKPPKNNKERLEILKKMYLHSQFCMSGDNTLPATEHAIRTITDQEADEYFVIVLSDANFDRYGILPSTFSALLTSNPKVNAFAIFIGSLGNQAHVLSKQLPAGRAFVCFDSADLPQILQKIFTSALLH